MTQPKKVNLLIHFNDKVHPVRTQITAATPEHFRTFIMEEIASTLNSGRIPYYHTFSRYQMPEKEAQKLIVDGNLYRRLSLGDENVMVSEIKLKEDHNLQDCVFCLSRGIDPLSPQGKHANLVRNVDYRDGDTIPSGNDPKNVVLLSHFEHYNAIQTDNGVLLFSQTEEGNLKMEQYKAYLEANAGNPELGISHITHYDNLLAYPASVADKVNLVFTFGTQGEVSLLDKDPIPQDVYADVALLRGAAPRPELTPAPAEELFPLEKNNNGRHL